MKTESVEVITIIRDSLSIYIKRENEIVDRFVGINSNQSIEHNRLKTYLSELCGFTMKVEQDRNLVPASIESILLPYYVSQDYGWVMTLKSFAGLEFYRNFKQSYYDYYLGVENEENIEQKRNLETEKHECQNRIQFLSSIKRHSDDINVAVLNDEASKLKALEYIEQYKIKKDELIDSERKYANLTNEFKLNDARRIILLKIKRDLLTQNPIDSNCPTCQQRLTSTMEEIYDYEQWLLNTKEELEVIKSRLKDIKGNINSELKKIYRLRSDIESYYRTFEMHYENNTSLDTWIKTKVTKEFEETILNKIGEYTLRLDTINKELKNYKTEDDITAERNSRVYHFNNYFMRYAELLGVNTFDEKYLLYKRPYFNQQGVELLKALLSYHFAFNNTIKKTEYVHRFPLCLDAIFKEDVDENNKKLILHFIAQNKPNDTQVIFSVAESTISKLRISEQNEFIFDNKANLIKTGDSERTLLGEHKVCLESIKNDTLDIITTI